MNIADCTVPEKILMAAYHLEQEGQVPFSAESLIVASWQKFPKTFGLKGYAELYPDSNKVLSSIMGEKGLARRGWLLKMGQKLYSLSRDGRLVVNRLLQGGENSAPSAPSYQPTLKLSRDQERNLLAMLESSAAEKFLEGRKPELTFADASRFWGISDATQGGSLDSRMNRFRSFIHELDQILKKGSIELSNGRSISDDDINLLTALNEYLEERFSRHLNLLKNRVEKS